MKKLNALFAAAIAAAAITAGCSSDGGEGSAPVPKVKTVSVIDIEKLNDGKALNIAYYYGSDRVREIEGRLSKTPVNNKDDALTVIRELADIIGCKDPLNELEYSKMNSNDGGWVYVFDQYYRGVPVRDGSVSVSADSGGNTTRLYNDFIENVNVATEPKLSAEEALKLAKEKYGCDTKGEPELVIIQTGRESIYLTWDIKLKSGNYPDETFLDANNGAVCAENGPIPD